MVIVKLQGGLGNQMFQYAVARALSELNNEKVRFDLSWFEKEKDYYNRHDLDFDEFTLNEYKILGKSASEEELREYFFASHVKKLVTSYYHLQPLLFQRLFNYYKEVNKENKKPYNVAGGPFMYQFCPEVLEVKNECYLDGYWLTENYFRNDKIDISDSLRRELSLKKELEDENAMVAEEIKETSSISIHVRRKDMATLDLDLPESYYKKALRGIDEGKIFLFSDDIEWSKRNLEFNFETEFVGYNTAKTGYKDLHLMSLCDHNIIADSTFSWWGAWLNENSNKEVFAPSTWRGTEVSDTDIIPDRWNVINV